MARNYTVSPKLLKARREQAVAKYGTHTKVDGMARCAGKCRRLMPYEAFAKPPEGRARRGIQSSWCADCRAAWKEHGLRVTNTLNPLRNGS